MKTILVLLDGLSDRPQKELKGKTPLQAAHTPNMDALAAISETGTMIPWKPGIPLGTEAAHFHLMGYPMEDFPGRGIISALTVEEELETDALYLMKTWAYLKKTEEGYRVLQRDLTDLTKEEVSALSQCLPREMDGISIEWQQQEGPHSLLKLKGKDLDHRVSDSDPFYPQGWLHQVMAFETEDEKAVNTADFLNRYILEVMERLKNHPVNKKRIAEGKEPANGILTKWAGKKTVLEPFQQRYGMKGVMLAGTKLLKGVARLTGMDYVRYESFQQGIQWALEDHTYDYIHLHNKKPDDASHTMGAVAKKKIIETIDQELGTLIQETKEKIEKGELLLIITSDHTTASDGKMIHTGDAVPILFCGKTLRPDGVKKFDEKSVSQGSLRMSGADLIPLIMNYTERSLFYSYRMGGKALRYVPTHIPRLK
ncbi:2,3-bisphosphoglycerate-independent phosphoglycerate mutase [Tindallia magadiensis]|uniref:2,3-bisphosphoglycerate-independent phosphoglycerate mutase n=1 Tax=Tindallia magadiensis TaxID=69895 RepID=A0A1I3HC60_9FIRM|nr:alkaline phosphatase family protein [Tindallia magadiensis]SFI33231.1 2,3-bisphosphoglycerate-independent phosphoglycerate mutase [Tindallia magadiensis]